MALLTIQAYIKELKEEGLNTNEIATRFGVSQPMVSSYTSENFNCRLTTAVNIFRDYEVVLHPYAIESLKFELEKQTCQEK